MSQAFNELFLAGCGVFGPWTIRVSHPQRPAEEHTFSVPYALVGSRADNCLRLVDAQVSRRHAYLQALPGGVFCVDLGSRSGLRFDKDEHHWGWLRPNQPVHIGPFTLELLPNNSSGWLTNPSWAPADPLRERARENTPLAPVVGNLAEEGKILAEWRMNRVLGLVGRTSRCLVHIEDRSVSRQHCSLVRTPLGLWIVDLLSRKGTLLNGTPITCARLQEGDKLQVGKYTLQFWYRQPKAKAIDRGPAELKSHLDVNGAVPSTELVSDKALQPVSAPRPATTVAAPRRKETILAGQPDQLGVEGALVMALVSQFDQMQQQMFDQFQESLMMATRLFASLHQEQSSMVRQELDHLHGITAELHTLQKELNNHLAAAPSQPELTRTDEKSAAKGPETSIPAENVKTVPAEATPKTPSKEGASPASEDVHVWLNQRISSLQEERQTRWNKLLGMILGN